MRLPHAAKLLFRVTLCTLFLSSALVTLPAQAQNSQNFNRDGDEDELIATPQIVNSPAPVSVPPPATTHLQATDIQMRMLALENLVRGLTGQVEKIQFQNSQLLQAQQKTAGDYDMRFKDIEQKLLTQEANMKGLMAAQQSLAQQQASQPAPAAATPVAAIETPLAETSSKTVDAPNPKDKTATGSGGTLGTISKSKDDTAPKPSGNAQAQYDEAFAALRQAKYDDAEKAFDGFLRNNPKHALTENAKYWLAETHYVRGNFPDAAVAFAEAYQEFPKGSKAADNLLKLSMSLGSMGKKQDACVTLVELSKKFPQASAVTRNRAEQQKKTLGCS